MDSGTERGAQAAVDRPRPPRLLFRVVRRVERLFGAVLAGLERRDIAALRPWLRLARSREFWRFVRFLATGGLNFAFYYTLFTALHLFGVRPIPAVIGATVVAVLFNFVTTGRLVFGSGRLHLLPRFIGVYVVQLAANIVLLRLLMRLGVPVLAAEALVIFALALATFFALRRFVFSPDLVARSGSVTGS
jgi:putative flippase GtrA